MTKFLRLLGAKAVMMLEELIKTTLISERQICPRSQFVDTTAQPKNIEYPKDAALLNNEQQVKLYVSGRARTYRNIHEVT